MKAFPHLLDHLDDRRHSIPFEAVRDPDVGQACLNLLFDSVISLPEGYHRAHGRPSDPFTQKSAREWLAKRKDKSILEIQLEILDWLIQKEEESPLVNDRGEPTDLLLLKGHRAALQGRGSP